MFYIVDLPVIWSGYEVVICCSLVGCAPLKAQPLGCAIPYLARREVRSEVTVKPNYVVALLITSSPLPALPPLLSPFLSSPLCLFRVSRSFIM